MPQGLASLLQLLPACVLHPPSNDKVKAVSTIATAGAWGGIRPGKGSSSHQRQKQGRGKRRRARIGSNTAFKE